MALGCTTATRCSRPSPTIRSHTRRVLTSIVLTAARRGTTRLSGSSLSRHRRRRRRRRRRHRRRYHRRRHRRRRHRRRRRHFVQKRLSNFSIRQLSDVISTTMSSLQQRPPQRRPQLRERRHSSTEICKRKSLWLRRRSSTIVARPTTRFVCCVSAFDLISLMRSSKNSTKRRLRSSSFASDGR